MRSDLFNRVSIYTVQIIPILLAKAVYTSSVNLCLVEEDKLRNLSDIRSSGMENKSAIHVPLLGKIQTTQIFLVFKLAIRIHCV